MHLYGGKSQVNWCNTSNVDRGTIIMYRFSRIRKVINNNTKIKGYYRLCSETIIERYVTNQKEMIFVFILYINCLLQLDEITMIKGSHTATTNNRPRMHVSRQINRAERSARKIHGCPENYSFVHILIIQLTILVHRTTHRILVRLSGRGSLTKRKETKKLDKRSSWNLGS